MEVLLAKEIQNNPKWKCHYQLTSKNLTKFWFLFKTTNTYIVPSFVFPTHFLFGREVVCEGFVFQTVTTFGAPIEIIFQMMGHIGEAKRNLIDDRALLKQSSMWKRFLLNLLSSFQHPLPPQGWLEGEYIRWRRPKTKGAQQSLWAFIVISIYSYRIAMRMRKKEEDQTKCF